MTESESIRLLQNIIHVSDNSDECNNVEIDAFHQDAIELAIQALEEIQQHRAIGTVEEFKELKEIRGNCKDCAGCTVWKCDCSNIRAKAIDDFLQKLNLCDRYEAMEIRSCSSGFIYEGGEVFREDDINEIVEQMKAGE